jgi:hypothetical protein
VVTAMAFCNVTQAALKEILVAATKCAESIQGVWVSVSAINAEQVEPLKITDMQYMSLYISRSSAK